MDKSEIYFLVVMALVVLAVIWIAIRIAGKQEREKREARIKTGRYVHHAGHHPVLREHPAGQHRAGQDIWDKSKMRSERVSRHGVSTTAHKIYSDDEAEDEAAMSTIKYVPTDFFKPTGTKR